jgi:hypothetical protein
MRIPVRVFFFITLFCFIGSAQGQNPVQFSFTQEPSGNEVLLKIKARVPQGNEIFSVKKISDEAPIHTQIRFDSSAAFVLKDSVQEKGAAKTAIEPDFNNVTATFSPIRWNGNKSCN